MADKMEYVFYDLPLTGNKDIDIPAIEKLEKDGWKFIGIASNFMAFKKQSKQTLTIK